MASHPRLRPIEAIEAPRTPAFEDVSGALGALYVLEGSALGARLLIKRVEPLGFGPDHGARHLSRQASSLTAWKQLVEILDTDIYSPARAITSANAAFAMAQTCMLRARNG